MSGHFLDRKPRFSESKNANFSPKESSVSPKELSFKNKLILRLSAFFVQVWSWTLRFSIESEVPLKELKVYPRPFLVLFWHNRLFLTVKFYRSIWRPRKTFGLTSASKDGAWVSELLKYLGVSPIRGSSSKRGQQAAYEIVDTLTQQKGDVVITPDGPRGPVYSIKPALLNIAEASNASILCVSAEYKNAWRLKNWDRFFIPKPFSKVVLRGTYYADFEDLKERACMQGVPIEECIRQALSKGCPLDTKGSL